MTKKSNPEKAAKHESMGDELMGKGKPKKALAQYRKALECHPDRAGIFDKLIKAKDEIGGDWKMDDFAESVSWTMGKQEQENPPIKQVHAMLSPEWKQATELALKILSEPAGAESGDEIEKLVGMGDVSTRALIAILLSLKAGPEQKSDETVSAK